MEVERQPESLVMAFSLVEAHVLLRVLREVAANYQVRPEDMEPRLAEAWYSTRGCRSAKMSAEETRDWLAALRDFRGGQLALLADWTRQLGADTAEPIRLQVKLADAPSLLTVLNDHRLLRAAQHGIGEEDMSLRQLQALEVLPQERQRAVFEIHFLAWIMEELLRATAPEAANWMNDGPELV